MMTPSVFIPEETYYVDRVHDSIHNAVQEAIYSALYQTLSPLMCGQNNLQLDECHLYGSPSR